MLSLPRNKSSREEMLISFEHFEICLLEVFNMCGKPKLITIACSSVDMFTPASDAHWILNRVVKKIKSAYGNHNDLIFDDDVELSL